jgi:peroxiredoxin
VIHDNPDPLESAAADGRSPSLSANPPASTGSPQATAANDALPSAPELGVEPVPGRPPIRLSPLEIAAILALVVFTIFITWRAKSLERAMANRDPAAQIVFKTAPGFSLPALDGRTVSLSDYAGKTVVISYWASWCGPCKVEMPELRDFYKRYHKADSDFEILAISIDENRSEAERYAAAESLPFPVLLDSNSKVADSYSVEGIPTLVVIDKTGKVSYASTGLDQAMQVKLMSQLGIKFREAFPTGKDEGAGTGDSNGETKP